MKIEIMNTSETMSVFTEKQSYPVKCLRPGESFFVPDVDVKRLRPRIEHLLRDGKKYTMRTIRDDNGNLLGCRVWRVDNESYTYADYPENTSEYKIEKDFPIPGNISYSPFLDMTVEQVAMIKDIDLKNVAYLRSILSNSKVFREMKFQTRYLKEEGTMYVKRVA